MIGRLLAGTLFGLLTILLPACDSVSLEKLKPGLTTMQQAQEIMGPPAMEWQDTDGSVTWEYPRMPNGIVNYMIDFGPERILREVRQVLTDENFARVKEGMTREEIHRLLGQPANKHYFPLKKEHVWDWKTKSEGAYDYYFNVHFDESGRTLRTSTHFVSLPGG